MPISPLAGKGGPAPKAWPLSGVVSVPLLGDEHDPTLDPLKRAKGLVNPADKRFDCPRWHLGRDTETLPGQKGPVVPGSEGGPRYPAVGNPHDAYDTTADRSAPADRGSLPPRRSRMPLVTGTLRVARRCEA